MTFITGFAGVGKSFVCMSIMAALSNGSELPDFSIAPKMKSVILLGEDGAADTLKPRMMMLGADEDNYFAMSIGVGLGASLSMDLGDDAFIPRLSQFIQQKEMGLLVIDPILSFTPHLDPRGEVQVRKVLGNLTVLAESTGCSIIAVSHKNKDRKQNNDLHRISGSQAFGAVARTVLEIIHDEHNDDKMILRVLKNNLAKKPAPLGFQVMEDENGEAVFEWLGELDEEISIRSLRKRNTPKIDRTIKFLERTLSAGPVSSSMIKSKAEREGIKEESGVERS